MPKSMNIDILTRNLSFWGAYWYLADNLIDDAGSLGEALVVNSALTLVDLCGNPINDMSPLQGDPRVKAFQ